MSLGMMIAVVVSVVSFAVGGYCIAGYSRTRKVGLLRTGLLLMLVVPGVILLVALAHFLPLPSGTYGPPPTTRP